ncbi:hypothetical protein R1sor_011324 [Riccia sorocarpa]|uniref:Uncharacterized protein n=1 Tax=Riccia sorocarpa TaxID=122646 RepID=A0ABD3I0L5_9MARC
MPANLKLLVGPQNSTLGIVLVIEKVKHLKRKLKRETTRSPVLPNADGAIPSSPEKGRSTVRDRKVKERPSPLGISHRTEAATFQGRGADGETPRRAWIRSSGDGKVEVGVSNRETEVEKVEEGSNFPPIPVTHTLLGDKLEAKIPGEEFLPDTERLHKCMELLAGERGLEEVNLETARCVNKALDVYLKAFIQPLVELVPARRTGQEVQTREKGRYLGEANCLDSKVAVDLNPQVLGEDGPIQLERISFRAFDVQLASGLKLQN